MHPVFQITSSDIQALNDEQARALVARLCKAELQSKGAGTDSVTWGGDQRAKDGGVDVRVDITPTVGISGYVPKDATAYQVKAEPFGPAKISGEMAPKGTLRPAITEFSEKSGAYIIASTRDSLSDSSLKSRKKAMADCLESYGLAGRVHLDFYDSRKIADWVENFPAIVAWVRSKLGRPLDGWQSYGPWAYYETNVEDEYLLDDKIKVLTPDSEEGIDITKAIDRLRGEIGKIGTSARIVGLSGVGKSRFAQALFDSRIATSNASLNQENVLYTDLSHNPTPQPIFMLEALYSERADSVVVVDNCGQEIHQKLTEIVKRPNSKIRLITIEYDIRDDLPEGTTCYRLEGSSNEVIAKLLKRRYQALSALDVDKIVEFSDGNARVAFALASTSETKGELAQLTDDALFQRLFLQKQTASEELLRCAEAASLLYSFDVEDTSEKSELAVLANVSEVTISTFFKNIVELQRRGLIQARGKWRAVLPHAISNRLALRALQANPPGFLVQRFVTDSSERVARSFSRRLGYLHESKDAQGIVNEWLKPGGLLGDVNQLNRIKQQMLENIAPVNQHAALNALLRAVKNDDFVSISNPNRAHFARLLRSLAYEQDLFEQAATALSLFALKEPENHKPDPIRDILKSLCYIHSSGTQASPEQRATFVRTLAFSVDEAKQKLALTLLQAGLEAHHFLCRYAIKPVQQFAYTTGKNATDSTLIIDAMDLLYTRKFDGFCLITSDSDFTGLAMRLREEGLTVLGFGEKKTPEAFRNACHKFVFTEVLRPSNATEPAGLPPKAESEQKPVTSQIPAEATELKHEFPKKFVLTALEQSIDDAGWAGLGAFGSYLTKLQPDFDSRLYGYKKLSDLVKAKTDLFVTEERQVPGSNQKVLYLRAK